MNCTNGQEIVRIKKYPNRRYYDTARSRHITLNEIHDLILQGHDICITDSRSGSDITNAVLFQIVLDKCQPKVDLFPTSILHWMIRTDRSAMQESVERFFEPFTGMLSASRKQVEDFWRRAIGGQVASSLTNPVTNPMAWASSMVDAMQPSSQPTSGPQDTRDVGDTDDTAGSDGEIPAEAVAPNEPATPDAGIEELRRQIRDLTERIDQVQAGDTTDRP